MKVNSINNQNFRGNFTNRAVDFVAKHPAFITGLAGCSVIGQKIVMSSAEATIGPAVDLAVGRTITKITDEKDGRTIQSSKVQAVRTSAQAVGGTITGIIIRGLCIAGCTALFMKGGQKAGETIAKVVNPQNEQNLYKYSKKMSSWGKNAGGALAILVMMFTNFIIDPHVINGVNKKFTEIFLKSKKDETAPQDSQTTQVAQLKQEEVK